jgi:hypothetical protein
MLEKAKGWLKGVLGGRGDRVLGRIVAGEERLGTQPRLHIHIAFIVVQDKHRWTLIYALSLRRVNW